MRFTDPLWAILALPVLAGLVLSWRHVHGMAKPRKVLAFAVRAVMALFVVTALMGPQSRRPNEGLATMFVVDMSDSVQEKDRDAAIKFVDDALGGLGQNDLGGVIAFGATPQMDSAPAGRRKLGRSLSKVDGSASDLAAAIRLAAATMPEGKGRRIVILTDANETRGDAGQAAEAASADGIQIDYMPLGAKDRGVEATVLEMTTPTERRADEPFEIRVMVESTVNQSGVLVVDRDDGVMVARQKVTLPEGKSTIVIAQKLENAGFYRYRATLEPEADTDNRNNIGAAFVNVRGKPKVLMLQNDSSQTALKKALMGQGITVDMYGPEGIPSKAEEYQGYDAVILNDINAQYFVPRQMEMIKSAVRDTGIGLIMIGGENSFLPGGWYGSAVADALPVDLNIRQRKSFPSTTVLIVADASGSMGMMEDGMMKIQLAARAAEKTAELLSPVDKLGVAGSSDGIEYVAPIQVLSNKPAVISQIRKLGLGGGGIYAEPSVTFAEKELNKSDSKVRHFILLADGADVDTYGKSLAMISRMHANKITTSVVAIGDGKDVPFLKTLAAAGGGRFYLVQSASKLPAIFTQDVAVMGRSAIEEMVFIPQLVAGEEVLRGITGTPALYAYCLSDPRPLARVGMKSPKSDPILAVWQFGLGSSLAFTSDAKAQWATEWMGWQNFGQFWAQAVRSVSRRATQNDYAISTTQQGGKALVRVEAKDRAGNPLQSSDMKVVVSLPGGDSQDLQLLQEAPGIFSGSFASREMGSYIVTVAEPNAAGQALVETAGFSVPYPPEYRARQTNTPLLNQVAETTGGKKLETPAEALRKLLDPGETIQDLWAWMILAAFIMLPFDVANRRIALSVGEIFVKGWQRIRPKPRTQQTPERLDRLRTAKTRIATEVAEPVRVDRKAEPEAKPAPPVAPSRGSASSALLDAKRRRKEEDQDSR
jgi:uncharacterized membrane protein